MYITESKGTISRSILASENYISFSVTIKKENVEEKEGRRILPAGTVYPKNDETAEGLILHDVDVTRGDQPAALLVEGYVYESRLPEVITNEAKTAMKEIKYKKTHNE